MAAPSRDLSNNSTTVESYRRFSPLITLALFSSPMQKVLFKELYTVTNTIPMFQCLYHEEYSILNIDNLLL